MIHNPHNIVLAGKPITQAAKVMILVHGRGGTAQDILRISEQIQGDDFAFVAPQAAQNTWYPNSFMRPVAENEPSLSSALLVLESLRASLQADYNFKLPQIYWLGFSQGACLMLEFVARNAAGYGGIFGLSGGLIGTNVASQHYTGSFEKTPVFLGCSDADSHIPEQRVLETERTFRQMDADVTLKLYPNFPHTINQDELNVVNLLIADGALNA